ncbi:hypothetical protein BDV96DRAFT_638551 [Lophiotrema nucula]|uniref:Uncharacterized protein n=1 Tax=Lophiotrema nucula TaxID=690887 RepID=A0A6A5YFD5_9PLEO|nr:hypothetical protein BDV96DRAFT_638551 [Lophiotrema nucula]
MEQATALHSRGLTDLPNELLLKIAECALTDGHGLEYYRIGCLLPGPQGVYRYATELPFNELSLVSRHFWNLTSDMAYVLNTVYIGAPHYVLKRMIAHASPHILISLRSVTLDLLVHHVSFSKQLLEHTTYFPRAKFLVKIQGWGFEYNPYAFANISRRWISTGERVEHQLQNLAVTEGDRNWDVKVPSLRADELEVMRRYLSPGDMTRVMGWLANEIVPKMGAKRSSQC